MDNGTRVGAELSAEAHLWTDARERAQQKFKGRGRIQALRRVGMHRRQYEYATQREEHADAARGG